MDKKSFVILTLIIIMSFVIRVINLTFPSFTAEEARIANRGYLLTRYGTYDYCRIYTQSKVYTKNI